MRRIIFIRDDDLRSSLQSTGVLLTHSPSRLTARLSAACRISEVNQTLALDCTERYILRSREAGFRNACVSLYSNKSILTSKLAPTTMKCSNSFGTGSLRMAVARGRL